MKFAVDRPYADPEKAARTRSHLYRADQLAVFVRPQGHAGRIQGRPRSGDCSRLVDAGPFRNLRQIYSNRRGVVCVMARGLGKIAMWSMKADRELIELAKTKTLEAIADEFKLPPKSILKKAAKLGLTIKRKGKRRNDGVATIVK